MLEITSSMADGDTEALVRVACICGEPCRADERVTLDMAVPLEGQLYEVSLSLSAALCQPEPFTCLACGEVSTGGEPIASWTRPEFRELAS